MNQVDSPAPIYLDCNASNPILPEVISLLQQSFSQQLGNSSAQHYWGQRSRERLEQARQQLARLAGFPSEGVLFSSGATEANQLATLGFIPYGEYLLAQGRRPQVISSTIEHPSVLEPLQQLQRHGWRLELLPSASNGQVQTDKLSQFLNADTVLVSLMAVNNETGVIQNLSDVAAQLEGHPAWLHCDASQGFGRISLPERIELLSISGHKIYGPVGVGALLLRPRAVAKGDKMQRNIALPKVWQAKQSSPWPPLSPLFYGGGQQQGLRSGTLPIALIEALVLAATLLEQNQLQWRQYNLDFRQQLLKCLQPLQVQVTAPSKLCLEHVLNFSIPGANADTLLFHSADLIAAGRGSACHAGSNSSVLRAMGCSRQQIEGAIRFSWCHLTKEADWQKLQQRWVALL